MEKKVTLQEKINYRVYTISNWLELAENFFETAFHARELWRGVKWKQNVS
jgi:hypothetical protein